MEEARHTPAQVQGPGWWGQADWPVPARQRLAKDQRHRAAGVLVGMAAGDALGAPFEFGPPLPGAPVGMIGGGAFGWEPGEWTDDTQMALVIAQIAVHGDLRSTPVQDAVARGWAAWCRDAKDVGAQTSAVLRGAGPEPTSTSLRQAAADLHARHGRTAGNGSLMRTAPVALAHLWDEAAAAAAARELSDLTHADPEAGEACVIWTLAIRHAVLTGELSAHVGLSALAPERADVWRERLAEAEDLRPSDFHRNGWVVEALQAAWSAISSTAPASPRPADHLELALTEAARGGGDTDTVAAIAGGLLGAAYGASAVPSRWRRVLHGWPGLRSRDLICLAVTLAEGRRGGTFPDVMDYHGYGGTGALARHPHDPGVWLGGVDAVRSLPEGVDAVVSLCRLGLREVPAEGVEARDHVEIWLVDSTDPADNPHLDFVLADAAEAVAELRSEGRTVLLHCVQAQSRTPAVAALYGMGVTGLSAEEALADVLAALPRAHPNQAFRAALARAGC